MLFRCIWLILDVSNVYLIVNRIFLELIPTFNVYLNIYNKIYIIMEIEKQIISFLSLYMENKVTILLKKFCILLATDLKF